MALIASEATLAEKAADVKLKLLKIAEADIDDILTRPALGSLNFQEIFPIVKNTIDLAKEASTFQLDLLNEDSLDLIHGYSKPLIESLDALAKFSLSNPYPNQTAEQSRDALQNKAKRDAQSFCTGIIPFYGYIKLRTPETEQALSHLTNLIEDVNTAFQVELTKAKENNSKIEIALESARTAAGKTGVNVHAANFQTLAKSHRDTSKWWLGTTAFMAVLIASVSLLFMFFLLPPAELPLSSAAIIQRIGAKIVLFSVLYFGLIVAARNYRAHRHLAVINEHRQTALETFETFVEAAEKDEDTKNAVLLEATRCIFVPAVTGYLGTDEESPHNRIIEILKMVRGKE